MDNIGPLVIFILYLAITAWAKKRKAQGRSSGTEKPKSGSLKKPSSGRSPIMAGILERLKQELFEIDEEPIVIPAVEADMPDDYYIEEDDAVPIMEGSPSHKHKHTMEVTSVSGGSAREGFTLDQMLKSYSIAQQGILLHEIIGKPRALQNNADWFHN